MRSAIFGVSLLALVSGTGLYAQGSAVVGEVFLFQEVDRKPKLLATLARFYPRDHEAGPGEVTLLVVIDTAGRPDPHSLKIVKATDSAFATAARLTLLSQSFSPGGFRGHTVRVLMEHRMRFRPTPVSCPTPYRHGALAFCVDSTSAPPIP